MSKSRTIWITGLSGSGKTTLAAEVVKILRNKKISVIYLDGDQLREIFKSSKNSKKNHSRKSRLSLAMQYAQLCKIISSQGITVVIATISMFKEVHYWNRANLPNYLEIFLKVPLSELRKRDPKRIYQSYDAGKLKYVAGLDLLVDEPKSPDWLFDFNSDRKYSSEFMANKITKNL